MFYLDHSLRQCTRPRHTCCIARDWISFSARKRMPSCSNCDWSSAICKHSEHIMSRSEASTGHTRIEPAHASICPTTGVHQSRDLTLARPSRSSRLMVTISASEPTPAAAPAGEDDETPPPALFRNPSSGTLPSELNGTREGEPDMQSGGHITDNQRQL